MQQDESLVHDQVVAEMPGVFTVAIPGANNAKVHKSRRSPEYPSYEAMTRDEYYRRRMFEHPTV